ncbi:hypothetical protein [Streptomyces sp. NPDC056921]|uniref:hypothetical protein n=1 Tax=Streptomyces sp. NPDC056921 TaxID=3345966 RepID=UPI0036270ED7
MGCPGSQVRREGSRRQYDSDRVRGAAIAMAAVMFGPILHFQYAYGWSAVRAGPANLPLIVTVIVAAGGALTLTDSPATGEPA